MSRWIQQPDRLVTLVLAALCGVLVLGLMLQRMLAGGGEAPGAVPVAPMDAEGSTSLTTRSFELPPTSEYAEITRRPLFHEDRRPEEDSDDGPDQGEAQAVAATEPPPVTLTGVIITPEVRVAMLEHNRRNEPISLKQGETLDGWTLESVDERRAVFASGSSKEPVLLEVYTGPAGGGRRAAAREQPVTEADQNQAQDQSAADLIRERIARERERRRELIEQARQRNRERDSDKEQ